MSAGLIGFVADGGGFMAVLETFKNTYRFNVSSKDNSLNALTRIMMNSPQRKGSFICFLVMREKASAVTIFYVEMFSDFGRLLKQCF